MNGIGSANLQLLISPPDTGDENFDRTVIYVIDHSEAGALGVVINKPMQATVPPQVMFGIPCATPAVLFSGGPVSTGSFLVLGSRSVDSELKGLRPLSSTVALLSLEGVEDGKVLGVDRVRVFTGHAGWGPGQLDSEVELGMWTVLDAQHDDVFCLEPDKLWRTVLSRQGGRLAAMARFPADPSWN